MPCNQPAHQHVGGKSWNTLQKQGETESELTLHFAPPFPDTAKHIHPVLLPCTLQMCPQSPPQQCAHHMQLPTTSTNRWERTTFLPALTNLMFSSMQWSAAYFEYNHKLFFLKWNQGPNSDNSGDVLDKKQVLNQRDSSLWISAAHRQCLSWRAQRTFHQLLFIKVYLQPSASLSKATPFQVLLFFHLTVKPGQVHWWTTQRVPLHLKSDGAGAPTSWGTRWTCSTGNTANYLSLDLSVSLGFFLPQSLMQHPKEVGSAGQGRWFSPSTLLSWDLTWSPADRKSVV